MASRSWRSPLSVALLAAAAHALAPRRAAPDEAPAAPRGLLSEELAWHPLAQEPQGALSAVTLVQTRSGLSHTREQPCKAEAVCVELHDRLGNNLYTFERALWIAAQLNFCFVTLPTPVAKNPMSAMVSTPEDGVVRLQPGAPNLTRSEVSQRCSVNCLECAPPRRAAASHMRQCSEWGPCDLGKHKLERPTIQMLRNTMQEAVVPTAMFRCDADAAKLPEETLVMHLRSGDTLESRSGFYPQPPCAYYDAVMRNGNQGHSFSDAVIVTEPDLRHPCLEQLQASFPGRIRVQARSVAEDACTVASAQNLAISFGTWGPALSRLNANLRNLYVPFGEDGVTADEYGGSLGRMSRHWFRQAFYEDGMPYAQHLYSFPGFRCEWASRGDHFAKMLQYNERRVVVRSIPGRAS